MFRIKPFVAILVFFFAPITVFAKYVAVLEALADPVARDVVSLSDRTYLTDVLRSEAVKVLPAEQNFTIMTRENINAMLPPGKSIEDCEGSCLAETGRNIAADYVAQARVGMFGGSLTLSVEMYETAGNKLVASFNGDGETVKDLLAIVKQDAPGFFKKVKGGRTGFEGVGGIGEVSGGGDFSFQGSRKFIIEIVTDPAGALPTIDGKGFQKCTSTPCKVQLEAGEHRFVASKDHFEDAEVVVNVSANNQQVVLNLLPAYGELDLRPEVPGNVGGGTEKLTMTIDGYQVQYGKVVLDPGIHAVRISHPCYDPVEFKVSIEKQKTETFYAKLNRGVGGLILNAEKNGDPQAVPVYIDGTEVGSTPFEGEVPMCAEVSVGNAAARQVIATGLKWHEVVSVTHQLRDIQVGESVPTNVEPSSSNEIASSNVRWWAVGVSAAVAVSGTVLAVAGNSKAKSASERNIKSESDYKKNKDDARNGQNLRTAGIVTAIIGAVGLGFSFAF